LGAAWLYYRDGRALSSGDVEVVEAEA
jgi:hypothetical protein